MIKVLDEPEESKKNYPSFVPDYEEAQKSLKDSKPLNSINGFVMESPAQEEAKELEKNYIKQHIIQAATIINKANKNYYIDPDTGYQITNASPERIWVAQNVLIIFSTGSIFDTNDKQFLDEIFTYFDNTETEFLGCEVYNLHYTTDLIQKMEKMCAIGNGNYHICCFIIVYADDEKVLEKAPEPLYSHQGLVANMLDQEEIRDEMIRMLLKYGYTKFVPYQPSVVNHICKDDPNTLPETKLQYDSNIEYDSATNRELFSNMKTKDSVLGTRQRINGSVDGIRSHPRAYRAKNIGNRGENTKDKYANDNYISYNSPSSGKLGVNIIINEPLQTRLNNQKNPSEMPVYKLFDNEEDKTVMQMPNNKEYGRTW